MRHPAVLARPVARGLFCAVDLLRDEWTRRETKGAARSGPAPRWSCGSRKALRRRQVVDSKSAVLLCPARLELFAAAMRRATSSRRRAGAGDPGTPGTFDAFPVVGGTHVQVTKCGTGTQEASRCT